MAVRQPDRAAARGGGRGRRGRRLTLAEAVRGGAVCHRVEQRAACVADGEAPARGGRRQAERLVGRRRARIAAPAEQVERARGELRPGGNRGQRRVGRARRRAIHDLEAADVERRRARVVELDELVRGCAGDAGRELVDDDLRRSAAASAARACRSATRAQPRRMRARRCRSVRRRGRRGRSALRATSVPRRVALAARLRPPHPPARLLPRRLRRRMLRAVPAVRPLLRRRQAPEARRGRGRPGAPGRPTRVNVRRACTKQLRQLRAAVRRALSRRRGSWSQWPSPRRSCRRVRRASSRHPRRAPQRRAGQAE